MLWIIVLLTLTCCSSSAVIEGNKKTGLLTSFQHQRDNCRATINACESSKSVTQPLNCFYNDFEVPVEMGLCSAICENGRTLHDSDKCKTFCSEYVRKCLPYRGLSNITTKAAVKPSPNNPSITEFPNTLDCFVPRSVCRELAHLKRVIYYPIACYLDTSNVVDPNMKSCWELCNSVLTEKCNDFCSDYLRLCPDLKLYDKTTTTRLDENEWPFKEQCTGITSSQCRNDRFVGARHYNTNCFLDTSQLDFIMRSCEEVCGDGTSSDMDRCYDFCSFYLYECLGITTPAVEVHGFNEKKSTLPDGKKPLSGEGLTLQAQTKDVGILPSTEPSTHAPMCHDITSPSTEPSTHAQIEGDITSPFTKPSASKIINHAALLRNEHLPKVTLQMLIEDPVKLLSIVGLMLLLLICLSALIWCLVYSKKRNKRTAMRTSPGIRREGTDSSHRWLLANSAVCNATQTQGEQC